MAVPANGSRSNPVAEGYYVDYSDQNKTRPLHKPSWGFQATNFPSLTNVVNVTSSGALVSAMSGSNRIVQIASGSYTWNAKALPGDNVIIQGAGMTATTLTMSGISTSNGFGLDVNRRRNFVLRDLDINCNNQAFIALLIRMCSNVLIERCRIRNGYRLILRLPSTTRFTVRFCEVHTVGSGGLHCISASTETSDASPGTEFPSYFSIYSNKIYGAGDHNLDTHAEFGEIAGNHFYNSRGAQTKQPDGYELYFHRNRFGSGSLYGTRTYGTKSSRGARIYVYDNWYEGGYSRAYHVGGENNTTAVSTTYWANNRFGSNGTSTPSVTGGNRVVYVKPGTLEANASGGGLTTAPSSMISMIDALRALDSGTTPPPVDPPDDPDPPVDPPDDPNDPPPPPPPAGAPYPASEFITNWQWTDEIAQIGQGGDNWPNSWDENDRLYVCAGDWNGFNNAYATKQTSTFGYVSGSPPAISGTNVYPFGAAGNGRNGRKASGLYAQGGFYVWMRNADLDGHHARLLSSDDGTNWVEWFTFTEFSYITFVQFGQDNANAPGNYVYMVSPNGNDAYIGYNSFILMRVPVGFVTNRSAYEFFTGVDTNGNATWSTNIASRTPVFEYEGRCSRSGISYNSHIQRYVWWVSHYNSASGNDGFGVYEAPNMWGPWRTVFFARTSGDWDRDSGDAGHFPTKWMASDGSHMWALFSGDDSLTVRRATYSIPGTQAGESWSGRVAVASDDAEQAVSGGATTLFSTNLDMDTATITGIRFTGVNVPRNAAINAARLHLTASSSTGDATTITIAVESALNPATYAATANNITGRAYLGQVVTWGNVGAWQFNQSYTSPDIKVLIQALVNDASWAPGMAVAFKITSNGAVGRKAKTFDNDPTQAARLEIFYTSEAPPEDETLLAVASSRSVSRDTVAVDVLLSESIAVASHGPSKDTVSARITAVGADLEPYRGLEPPGAITQ